MNSSWLKRVCAVRRQDKGVSSGAGGDSKEDKERCWSCSVRENSSCCSLMVRHFSVCIL